ncbi:phosphate butyryltransferase [Alkalihalobacterium chitinilyticum]|uniref:Phosphate butyryltransferase n=1 Tax=Alkalihalobacterium chitinilyticum TaxID=2980103 RepID=A0ABT5V9T9_9BACI|nr:phosphate butyryltransferase [Alkalihalobacterium chitinilyticum]MDE5412226.1 phosphate butyryltransferase [Alkalihalobacterium chitinilyticum]
MLLQNMLSRVADFPNKIVAVAAADDERMMIVVEEAVRLNLASFLLFGNEEKIRQLVEQRKINWQHVTIVSTDSVEKSAHEAVKAVRNGDADILMKGMVPTSILMKAVLNKDYGLRVGKLFSHVAAFDIPNYDKLLFITDSALNIAPDLNQKVQIIENSVEVARKVGVQLPKVAPIAAVEVVNPEMVATVDAALLSQMNRRGQIKNCIVDGPLGLDNAISKDAAQYKGIKGDVAGEADILLVPTIEIGNILYKSLVYFAKANVGGFITGAKAPIVLTSRSDSTINKLYSIAFALNSISTKKVLEHQAH